MTELRMKVFLTGLSVVVYTIGSFLKNDPADKNECNKCKVSSLIFPVDVLKSEKQKKIN